MCPFLFCLKFIQISLWLRPFLFQLQCNASFYKSPQVHTRICNIASTQMHCFEVLHSTKIKESLDHIHWTSEAVTTLYSPSGSRCFTITRLKATRAVASRLFCLILTTLICYSWWNRFGSGMYDGSSFHAQNCNYVHSFQAHSCKKKYSIMLYIKLAWCGKCYQNLLATINFLILPQFLVYLPTFLHV